MESGFRSVKNHEIVHGGHARDLRNGSSIENTLKSRDTNAAISHLPVRSERRKTSHDALSANPSGGPAAAAPPAAIAGSKISSLP